MTEMTLDHGRVGARRPAGSRFGRFASRLAGWGRTLATAIEARHYAQTYLFQSDAQLAAQGLTRDAVFDRLREILDDAA